MMFENPVFRNPFVREAEEGELKSGDKAEKSYIVCWRTVEDYVGDNEFSSKEEAEEFAYKLASDREYNGYQLKSVWIEDESGRDLTGNLLEDKEVFARSEFLVREDDIEWETDEEV